jgi:hypothetical protein
LLFLTSFLEPPRKGVAGYAAQIPGCNLGLRAKQSPPSLEAAFFAFLASDPEVTTDNSLSLAVPVKPFSHK